MEHSNEFEEPFMNEDEFLFNFDAEAGDSSAFNFNYGVSDSPSSGKTTAFGPETQNHPFPVFPEAVENFEWLMAEDTFPTLESCFGALSDGSEFVPNHLSPISVLETIKTNGDSHKYNLGLPLTNHPKGSRSKKRRRRTAGYGDLPSQHCLWSNQSSVAISEESGLLGRRCQHCLVDKTPQWRAGPTGPKTLCNACGVRYKSGRLHPEYRPACSPTFSSLLHSNSHKKVLEMRMKK
ncbi:GATA transcription factor 1-like [Henckelia pumila]|uniref:GATA transcription factor 1-like n=1 Tax=Henckelia pumila TaxID=405737 RepID=UPI003C6E0109